jgi:hypothetical protein
MTATLSRIVFDSAGNIRMVIHPDHDAQLADPAFAPCGAVWADVSRANYRACGSRRDLLALAGPAIAAKNAAAGLAVAAQIRAMDAASAAETAVDT